MMPPSHDAAELRPPLPPQSVKAASRRRLLDTIATFLGFLETSGELMDSDDVIVCLTALAGTARWAARARRASTNWRLLQLRIDCAAMVEAGLVDADGSSEEAD
jgi:hypothetical protein